MKKPPERKVKTRASDESVQIGKRLRQIRYDLDLSQLTASQALMISRAQLANYEDARTPLRMEVALDVCTKFIYSEKWLATGEGDVHQLMNLRDDPIVHRVKRGTAFGSAYREILSPRYEEIRSLDPEAIRVADARRAYRHEDSLLDLFRLTWVVLLMNSEKSAELMQRLRDTGNRFCAQNVEEDAFNFSEGSALEECQLILPAKQILKLKQKLQSAKRPPKA